MLFLVAFIFQIHWLVYPSRKEFLGKKSFSRKTNLLYTLFINSLCFFPLLSNCYIFGFYIDSLDFFIVFGIKTALLQVLAVVPDIPFSPSYKHLD